MIGYLDYVLSGELPQYGQYVKRLFPWVPTDENGNQKEEILNNVSAGYIPGLIWLLFLNNNEKASDKVSKDTSTSNSKHGNNYVVDIPIGVTDTTFKIGDRIFTILVDSKRST